MGHVLLWHLDGRLPNLVLMRLAARHRALGDTVELRRGMPCRLLWDQPTHVYGSLLFTRSRPLGERLRTLYPDAVLGGTGWDATVTFTQVGILEAGPLDHTRYVFMQAKLKGATACPTMFWLHPWVWERVRIFS